MIHQIKLSNGQILQVEEGENCIHIAAMHEGQVDAYICEINSSGTLVMPNSGPAGEYLTNGLKLNDQPRTPIADAKLCYTVDGENWLPAPEGMKVMLQDALIPGEERGDLVFNFTTEGLIQDVWTDESTNAGTSSQTYDEILSDLVDDNS